MAQKPQNPFSMDMSKMVEEFTKMAGQYQIPGVDVQALVDAQRRNIEALTAANRAAFEGAQALAARQTEIITESVDSMKSALEALSKSGPTPQAAAQQVSLLKDAYEKTLKDSRELAEIVAKTNKDAAETINKRISEGLEEIRQLAEKAGK